MLSAQLGSREVFDAGAACDRGVAGGTPRSALARSSLRPPRLISVLGQRHRECPVAYAPRAPPPPSTKSMFVQCTTLTVHRPQPRQPVVIAAAFTTQSPRHPSSIGRFLRPSSPVTSSCFAEWSQTITRGEREVMTLEARVTTRPFAGSRLKGRVALSRAARVGAAIGGSCARRVGRLGRPDGVACVVDFPCIGAYSLITALVWAVDGRGEV